MAKSIPTKNSATDAGMTSISEGAYLGVGETLGRSIMGPGLGTMVGGVAAAASESGAARDRMAMVAGERAINELLAGGMGSSSQSSRGSI